MQVPVEFAFPFLSPIYTLIAIYGIENFHVLVHINVSIYTGKEEITMNCANDYCLYNKDYKCTLEEINIDNIVNSL